MEQKNGLNIQQTSGISAIKKTQNAEEGMKRYFQTTFQIISHFKRDTDKKYIYKLTGKKNRLNQLLMGSGAIHCYHSLGIRVKELELMLTRTEHAASLESLEKKEIFNELAMILDDTLGLEMELMNSAIKYEEELFNAINEGINIYDASFQEQIRDKIELHLVEALNKYPHVLYFDHLGELTGFYDKVKEEVYEESGSLRFVGLEFERDILREQKIDQYMELTVFRRMLERMKREFEFSSIKDLQMQTFPFRKILSRILNYFFNKFPVSKRGLESYRAALSLKKKLLESFIKANLEPVDYEELEKELMVSIAVALQDWAFKGPNYLVYLLKFVLNTSFSDVYRLLQTFGVYDIGLFCEILKFDRNNFLKSCQLLDLSRLDINSLSKNNNLFDLVEDKLNKLKKQKIALTQRNLFQILELNKPHEIEYVKDACKIAGVDYNELVELYQKKVKLERFIRPKFPVEWIKGYIYLYDLAHIFRNLARFIYYHLFSKISMQIARIIESYIKVKEDHQLLLLAVRRIGDFDNESEWGRVKIEELAIERIMNREEELALIFNAENNAFLVNGFILARLLNTSINEAISILKNDPSPIYEGIMELSLPADWVSPKSYIMAYDLLYRLIDFLELKSIEKEQKEQEKMDKKEKEKQKRDDLRAKTTLNWIEKKIVSGVMSVTTQINPSHLYWSDKDQNTCSEFIVRHSLLKGKRFCTVCGFDATDQPCSDHPDDVRDATPYDLFCNYFKFAVDQMKKLWPKLKVPDFEEIKYNVLEWLNEAMGRRLRRDVLEEDSVLIIEGERREVASKISEYIGELYDKLIYRKFKATLKK